jgi:hypothetical protein
VLPAGAIRHAVAGIVATVVVARLFSRVLLTQVSAPIEMKLVAFYAVVFGGLWLTCQRASRRFGTGRVLHDLGWVWRPTDIWRGIGTFLLARTLATIAILPWASDIEKLSRLTDGYERVPAAAFIVFAVCAIAGAPFFEELAFRGLLQRSLEARVGAGWAVVLQAAAFGLYHYVPELGGLNVPYVISLAATGLALGWIAKRTRRLGPSATTHLFNNVVAVAIVAARR